MQSWMIGLVCGIAWTALWPVLPPWPLCLLLAGITVCALRWRTRFARVVSGLACGCALGLGHGTLLLQHRLADDCAGLPLVVTGYVASLPSDKQVRDHQRRQRFEFSVGDLQPARCAGPANLILSYYGEQKLHPGEKWQFEVKLRKPWGLSNPGLFNMQQWFAQERIDAVGSVRESTQTQLLAPATGIYALHHRLRQAISSEIARLVLDRDVAAMLQAMTVADNSGIDPPLWSLCQQYGINHLLVISGSHIAFVAGIGYLLGGCYTRIMPGSGYSGAWVPPVFALLLACLYGALAGFSIPTQRALCMLGGVVVATLAGRRSDSPNNLLLAAAAVLMLNPLATLGSGFWLSFGAVAALLWLARWQRGSGACGRLAFTHGFMSLVMLPLGALFFNGGSTIAPLANLVMIPLVGLVVVPISLLAVVCFLGGWSAASTLWYLAGWPLQKLLQPAKALAEAGDGWLYVPLSADLPLAVLALLAATLLILPGGAAQKLLALVLALPMLMPPAVSPAAPGLPTRVTVLDVGQGTAVVVQSGERALVYDTGGGNPDGVTLGATVVLPYLQRRGITALDTLVISHPDLDHSAGAGDILRALPVDRLRYGGEAPVAGKGRPCRAGESWRWPGGQVFQFLSPAQEEPHSRNDSSCVLQIQVGKNRLLLPGDIESEQERALVQYWGDELRSDWLLAGHHGSRTSSSPTFLKRVLPEAAVFSSGYANRFGHPHPSVVQRAHQLGVQTFSTATDGALEFELAPGQPRRVKAAREFKRRYWM